MDGARNVGCLLLAVLAVSVALLPLSIAMCMSGGVQGTGASGSGQSMADLAIAESKAKKVPHENIEVNGDNDVKYAREIGGEPQMWCADFISWCARECDYVGEGKPFKSTTGLAVAFAEDGICPDGKILHTSSLGSYVPQPGDLACYGTHGSGPGHVTMVVKTDEATGAVDTVGGNEGGTKWGGGTVLYTKGRYNYKTGDWGPMVYLVHPNYPSEGDVDLTGTGDGTKGQLFAGKVDYTMTKEQFVAKWGPALDKWMKKKYPAGELNGHGNEYAEISYHYRLDPRFMCGVGAKESGCGKPGQTFHPHNGWGYGSSSYSTWKAGMAAMAKGVASPTGYYKNCKTVDEIMPIYSPVSDGNDTDGYIKDLYKWAAEMTKLAN